jgi:arabinose-5-phosphate isomerase
LRNGKKVIVSGLGKNVPICDKFVGTMLSLGLNSAFMHSNTAVHGDLGLVAEGDLVIILTKSGSTTESVYLYEQLKTRACEQWLITFDSESVLARAIPNTLSLTLDHEGDEWNIVPNNSTTLYLMILQALAIQVSKIMGVTLDDFRRNHPGGHRGEILHK